MKESVQYITFQLESPKILSDFLIALINPINFDITVKPVYNDHLWDREKVVAVWRWSLFRGATSKFFINCFN